LQDLRWRGVSVCWTSGQGRSGSNLGLWHEERILQKFEPASCVTASCRRVYPSARHQADEDLSWYWAEAVQLRACVQEKSGLPQASTLIKMGQFSSKTSESWPIFFAKFVDTFGSVSGTLDTFIWVMDTFVWKLWQKLEEIWRFCGHLDTLWTLLKTVLSITNHYIALHSVT
jgi:hypothetical protein